LGRGIWKVVLGIVRDLNEAVNQYFL
jgi:hypothetical protein